MIDSTNPHEARAYRLACDMEDKLGELEEHIDLLRMAARGLDRTDGYDGGLLRLADYMQDICRSVQSEREEIVSELHPRCDHLVQVARS